MSETTSTAGHDLNQPVLEVTDVSVRYASSPALEQISFQLSRGERIAVIGPNGAGKSTLFNVISGVLKPEVGQIRVYGSRPDVHACIAYVPQRTHIDWQFPANVADVVMMGRVGRIGLFRRAGQQDRDFVQHALEMVDMADLSQRQISELSGGQQQRVFIARALAQEADLLLMDEPLAGLDAGSQDAIFGILKTLRQQNVTVLMATHNLNLAAERFDRLMLLNQKIIALDQPDTVFTPEILVQAYGGQMHVIETPGGTIVINEAHYPPEKVPSHG